MVRGKRRWVGHLSPARSTAGPSIHANCNSTAPCINNRGTPSLHSRRFLIISRKMQRGSEVDDSSRTPTKTGTSADARYPRSSHSHAVQQPRGASLPCKYQDIGVIDISTFTAKKDAVHANWPMKIANYESTRIGPQCDDKHCVGDASACRLTAILTAPVGGEVDECVTCCHGLPDR